MFDKIVNDIKESENQETKSNINIFNNPAINAGLLEQKINNIDAMPEREMFELVKHSYSNILKNIFSTNDRNYLNMFMTSKFLTVLTQVVNVVQLTPQEKTYCNKLSYDYFTTSNTDPYIRQLFFTLSKSVNKEIIPALLAIGIPHDLAAYMALARYSSIQENVNIKRLNFIICTSNPEIMTEQMIVCIYEKLFDRVTPLFEGIMFDVYEEEEWMLDKSTGDNNVMDIYSIISLAILTILNNMPLADIRKVLVSYTGDFTAIYGGDMSLVRFSMKSLSEDYERILEVVNSLATVEGIYVP
jgi:hypothetical protein